MRRRLLTIAIFLLAGAVVNVAVAWGCDRWVPLMWQSGDGWPMRFRPLRSEAFGRRGLSILEDGISVVWWESGWPALSVRRVLVYRANVRGVMDIFGRPKRISLDPRTKLRPIWPGFAENTLFYATLLVLIPVSFALRRLIRRRRGLCPACGYDLRHAEHEACPECGVMA